MRLGTYGNDQCIAGKEHRCRVDAIRLSQFRHRDRILLSNACQRLPRLDEVLDGRRRGGVAVAGGGVAVGGTGVAVAAGVFVGSETVECCHQGRAGLARALGRLERC